MFENCFVIMFILKITHYYTKINFFIVIDRKRPLYCSEFQNFFKNYIKLRITQ